MSAVLPLIAQFGSNDGHMDGWGWVAIIPMAVMMGGMMWMMWAMMRSPKDDGTGTAEDDPITVLRRRYAAGELSTEEFLERLKVLENARR